MKSLEKEVLPRLFERKGANDSLRIWSVCCATGEEAYTLAMLLVEEAGRRDTPPQIQIFASDLHKRSLEKAREGFYPGDIAVDVSADRLKRFFRKESGGFRVHKELRDVVVFAPHNLLSAPRGFRFFRPCAAVPPANQQRSRNISWSRFLTEHFTSAWWNSMRRLARAEKDLRERERSLKAANEVLSRANANLKVFASAASHDLSEPLRTISVYSQILIKAFHEGNEPGPSGRRTRLSSVLAEWAGYWPISPNIRN